MKSELSTQSCMTGDKGGEETGFAGPCRKHLPLSRISFNIKDMGAQKASFGLKFVSLGEELKRRERFAWRDVLKSLRLP